MGKIHKIGIAAPVRPELASARFRLIIPSRHIEGYKYSLGEGDITIIPKYGHSLEAIRKLKAPRIYDMCDDFFDRDRGEIDRAIIRTVEYVTCTTPYLRDRIEEETGVTPIVISDPLEFPRQEPKLEQVKKVLWYGSNHGIHGLLDLDQGLKDYEVMIITNLAEDWCVPWSEENMRKGLDWCDVVIIPTPTKGPNPMAKSPNRMTEAINAGRFVVANPMPAYFGYDMYLGDIIEGLKWVKRQRKESLKRLSQAQNKVQELHSPSVIAAQWKALFDSILGVGGRSGKDSSIATSPAIGQA